MNRYEASIYTTGIQWPEPDKAPKLPIQPVRPVEHNTPDTSPQLGLGGLTIEGKALQIGKLIQKQKQAQEVQKVTIYLPKNLCSVLEMLKQQGVIESFSQTIREALYQYLTDPFPQNKK